MVSNNQSIATFTVAEALSSTAENPSEWLNSVVYDPKWAETDVSKQIRSTIMDLKKEMDWKGLVPDDKVSELLSLSMGRDLLRFPPVRGLLIRGGFESSDDPEIFLKEVSRLLKIDEESTIQEVVGVAESLPWKPSTKFSFRFCELFGLPSRFARAGTIDDRPPMLMVEPIRPLMPLLEFQERVKEKIIEKLEESGTSQVVMPTGSGKTRTSVEATIQFLARKGMPIGRVLWLADRDELCEQAVLSFEQIIENKTSEAVPIWRYWSGNTIDLDIVEGERFIPGVTVTSTQQLRNRIKSGDMFASYLIDTSRVIIIDEVHRNLDWNENIIRVVGDNNPEAAIIGLTATPLRRVRHETSRLSRLFENSTIYPIEGADIDPGLSLRVLTDMKILARRVDVDASELGVSLSVGGSRRMRMSESIQVLKAMHKSGCRSLLVFSESVDQSRRMATNMSLIGLPSRHIDSSTPTEDRRSAIKDFQTGKVNFLMNYDILTTGFDAPNTDGVAILRTTDDLDQPLIIQMVGRGLRGPEFKGTEDCKIFIRGHS